MADRFTGFWEAGAWIEPGHTDPNNDIATTIGPVPTEVLLERLRVRLEEAKPGTMVRIELIAIGDPE